MDLNADLGESFGHWTLGDDERLVPHLTSANLACGFHAGDFRVMEATVALCARAGRGGRRAARISRPPGLRPSPDALHPRRGRVARALPDRRARGLLPRRRRRAAARQAARRPLQPGRRRSGAGRRHRPGHGAIQPRPPAVRPGLVGADGVRRRRCRPALRPRSLRRPSLPGRWIAPAALRARLGPDRSGPLPPRRPCSIAGGLGRPPRTARASRCAPRASAATATRPARSRSRRPCARRWSGPGSRSVHREPRSALRGVGVPRRARRRRGRPGPRGVR